MEEQRKAGFHRPGGFSVTEMMLQAAGLYPQPDFGTDLSVLDIGCGEGGTLLMLHELHPDWQLTGVEPGFDEGREGNASFVCPILRGVAEALPLPDDCADIVLLECVYTRLQDPAKALSEIRRVLRPGGKVLVSDLYARAAGESPAAATEEYKPSCRIGRLPVTAEYLKEFRENGFAVLEMQDVSRQLAAYTGQLIFDEGQAALEDALGLPLQYLKERRCGYFWMIAEVSALMDTVSYAAKNSRSYGRKFKERMEALCSGTADDRLKMAAVFTTLPFTTPEEVRTCPEDFLCVSPKEIARVITIRSSGSTGIAKRLFFTAEDLGMTADFFSRGIRSLVRPGYRVGVFMEGQQHRTVGGLLKEGLSRLPAEVFVYGFIKDDALAAEQAADMDTLIGIPSQIYRLAVSHPALRPKTVLLSGDYVPESVIRTIEDIWQTKVFTHWGMTETGYGGGVQCEARGSYHMRDDDLYIEVIDPETEEPVPDGSYGEIVVTTLKRSGMPLIRYRTGDLGAIEPEPCPCGCLKPRLKKVMGRADGSVKLRSGERISIEMLDEWIYGLPGIADYTAAYDRNNDCLRLVIKKETGIPEKEMRGKDTGISETDISGKVKAILAERLACVPAPKTEITFGDFPASTGTIKRRLTETDMRERETAGEQKTADGAAADCQTLSYTLIISAAGISSRMGRFKPLLEIGGVPNIVRELRTFFAAGISRAVIVTGFRREDIEKTVTDEFGQDSRVTFVHNPDYASTKMFDSLRIGFTEFLKNRSAEAERVFTLPVDVPLVSVYTVKMMMREFEASGAAAMVPVCRGEDGHPILIRGSAVPDILSHDGSMGLKGALKRIDSTSKESGRTGVVNIYPPDAGTVMDADTPEAFDRQLSEFAERQCPGRERAEKLLRMFTEDERLIAHSEAVAALAAQMAQEAGLNAQLAYAAGCLHDIAKGEKHHAEAGADILRDLGYERVSEIVRTHMKLPEEYLESLNENMIVFLADKLRDGDRPVSVEERFARNRQRFADDPAALAGLEERYRQAKRCEALRNLPAQSN